MPNMAGICRDPSRAGHIRHSGLPEHTLHFPGSLHRNARKPSVIASPAMGFRLINKKRRQYLQRTAVSEHYVVIRLSNTCCVDNTAPDGGVSSEAEPSRSHQHGSLVVAPGWTLSLNVEKYLQKPL